MPAAQARQSAAQPPGPAVVSVSPAEDEEARDTSRAVCALHPRQSETSDVQRRRAFMNYGVEPESKTA